MGAQLSTRTSTTTIAIDTAIIDLKIDYLKYFDLEYDNPIYFNTLIINTRHYIFYRNVYTFINRFKNLIKSYSNNKAKLLNLVIFRGKALV